MRPLNVKKSRSANYKLLSIAKKFEPVGIEHLVDTCANIIYEIETIETPWEETFTANVSAPYVLARLCALFHGLQIDVGGQEYYKVTWTTILRHKKTGEIVTFYDYKGAISYGSKIDGPMSDNFLKDVKKLLKVLSDERCPHPYDGCVVGEIA